MAGVVEMPEKVIQKLNKRILPQWKACFLAAVFFGLLAHFYKITNWLPNWDSLVFRYDAQDMLSLGRWFLSAVCSIGSFYDVPFLNGILCILYHALGAVFICRMLDIRENVTSCLIGALVATFPTVTSVLMYNYVADGYGFAFLLSCLAAYFMTKEKPRYILAAILITLSAGIYQAYITVTVMLLVLHLADGLIFKCEDSFRLIKKGVAFLLTGLVGMAVYYGVLELLLFMTKTELLEYQGISSAASGSALNIADSLYTIRKTFLGYFFDFSGGTKLLPVLNTVICALCFVTYLAYAIKNKGFCHILRVLLLVVLAVLLVLGGTLLAFVNAWIDYHNLMLMGYVVFYLFFILLYERISGKEKFVAAGKWTVLAVAAVLIFNQVVIANVAYHKAQMAYEKSYGVLIRIADRIEQTEGSDECTRILVNGALSDSENYSAPLPPDITGITDGYILRADDETVGQSILTSALNDYCGKNYEFVSGSEKEEILLSEDIKNMSRWPDSGCITVKDGIIIIKL